MFLEEGDPIQIVFTDAFRVVKVKFLKESKTSREEIERENKDPENKPYKIYINYYPERTKVEVGDKLNDSLAYSMTLSKIMNDESLDYELRDQKDEAQRKKILRRYLESINAEKIQSAEKTLGAVNKDLEVFYRCFYNSFKMYRAKGIMVNLAKELIVLSGDTVSEEEYFEDIYLKLKANGFSDVLVRAYEEVIKIDFSRNRNNPVFWYQDARGLFAAVQLYSKALEMFISFSKRVLNGNIFNLENRSLDWDEAGAMEVFEPAVIMRYTQKATPEHEEFEKLIKKAALPKATLKQSRKKGKTNE